MQPLGLQLYSLRRELGADRDGALRRVAELGYASVEPYEPLLDPSGFRAVADDLGLAIPTAHGPALGPRRDELAEAAHTLGVRALVVPVVPAEEFAEPDGVARTAERLSEAAAWAAGRGLQLGYHNHWWEFGHLPDGRSAFEVLVDNVSPDVFFQIDVYWAAVAGVDVPGLLKRLGERVRYLHVKDGPARRGVPMTAVGAGTLAIPQILAAAPDTAGRVVELDDYDGDPFVALGASVSYLNGLADE